MFQGRKLINNFIFSNNHQCNYTKTISRLRRLIVKCHFVADENQQILTSLTEHTQHSAPSPPIQNPLSKSVYSFSRL